MASDAAFGVGWQLRMFLEISFMPRPVSRKKRNHVPVRTNMDMPKGKN
jgi:hypothetical protein